MKEPCLFSALHVSSSFNTNTMSKSNPSALNGFLQAMGTEAALRDHPPPEGRQPSAKQRQSSRQFQREPHLNAVSTGSSLSNSHHWSDSTLTGSVSGQDSSSSWGMDEAELDRAATEFVRRKFDKIGAALFEGRSTGSARVDEECKEWSAKFPHLEVRGVHLLDSMEDGTEMVAPDPFLGLNVSTAAISLEDTQSVPNTLVIRGRRMEPVCLQDVDESSPLYEEVIAQDGCLEEFFAFDNIMNDEVHASEGRHSRLNQSRLKRHHGLPPVTPNACAHDGVMSCAFNHLWTEVTGILQPLIAAIRENCSKGHDSAFSMEDSTLTPTEPALGEGSPQEQPYLLRGVRDPPTLTRASGQSGSKFLRLKYSTPSFHPGYGSTLPQLTNLSGVMQIRSLSLQQRAHSSYVPNVLPINDNNNSRECTPTPTISERPESSAIALRFSKMATPLSRPSDYQILHTPASTAVTTTTTGGPPAPSQTALNNRLISSRMTNRRNINTATLRPIEKPKTPALVPIDSGIRGFRLGSHNSPPTDRKSVV